MGLFWNETGRDSEGNVRYTKGEALDPKAGLLVRARVDVGVDDEDGLSLNQLCMSHRCIASVKITES